MVLGAFASLRHVHEFVPSVLMNDDGRYVSSKSLGPLGAIVGRTTSPGYMRAPAFLVANELKRMAESLKNE